MTDQKEGSGAKPQSAENEKAQAFMPSPPVVTNGGEKKEDGENLNNESSDKRNWFPSGIKPAEWIMIAFTAATAGAAWFGVVTASQTLNEMKSGGVDP